MDDVGEVSVDRSTAHIPYARIVAAERLGSFPIAVGDFEFLATLTLESGGVRLSLEKTEDAAQNNSSQLELNLFGDKKPEK